MTQESRVQSFAGTPGEDRGNSCCVSAAEALTRQLAQLGETDRMRAVLHDALDDIGLSGLEVEHYEVDHCKLTPWREISVAISLTARSRTTGERSQRILSGTIFSSVDDAQGQLQGERRSSTGGLRGHGTAAERARRRVALIPEMAMLVRLFPDDSTLTGLSAATDKTAMRGLLTAHLPECRAGGWTIRTLDCEPVQYKPGRLCTLRYTVTLGRPRHEPRRIEVFGKVYRDERWRRSYALLEATFQAAAASAGVWRAARPIAAVPDWRFIVQSAVAGRHFRHLLGDLTQPDATGDDRGEAERHLTAVGRAICALQRSCLPPGPCLDFRVLFAAQRENLEHLRQVNAQLARELQLLREAIARLARECPASDLCPAHGDFAHGNVLVETLDAQAPCIGIIDFDRAGQAEPAYDVAYFLTHLSSFAMRHPERAPQLRRLSEHLRRTYCELASVSPRRLALYESLDLSAYVLRNFRKRSHQPEWIGWATGQIAAAWERLDCVPLHARATS